MPKSKYPVFAAMRALRSDRVGAGAFNTFSRAVFEEFEELQALIMKTTSLKMRVLKCSVQMVPLLLVAGPITARPITPTIEVQCVLVSSAQIAQIPLAREGKFGRANHGHQIAVGTKNVLAIRIFNDPDRGPDSETFKKATLEIQLLPDLALSSEVSVDVLRSHYVDSASGWVPRGGYWWAKNPFQRVHFRRDNNGLYATLKQDVRLMDGGKIAPRPPQTYSVDVTCPVRVSSGCKLIQGGGAA